MQEEKFLKLSRRELDVLELASNGLLNKEIANRLNLSAHTISSYLRSIYKKLGVDNRTAAAIKALKNNLLE